jgi:hypothetical protein
MTPDRHTSSDFRARLDAAPGAMLERDAENRQAAPTPA